MLLLKGWNVGAHSVFLDQFETLIEAVETEKATSPNTYKSGANAKLLAAILKLSRDTIPTDPTLPVYRQGTTLGSHRKHWFRAKFGNGRFRQVLTWTAEEKPLSRSRLSRSWSRIYLDPPQHTYTMRMKREITR